MIKDWNRNSSSVIDFKIGDKYTVNNLTYEIVKVDRNFIECKLNNVIKKFAKILYCGVYAAMYYGKPLFLSSKIVRAEEEEFTPRKYTKRTK